MSRGDAVVIEPRFQGIPRVALGGYVGGLLAGGSTGAEAIFRRPVPLGRSLRREEQEGGEVALLDGTELLARARPLRVDVPIPGPVTWEDSEAAARRYPGLVRHLFPNCFTCGPRRAEGDGLRVFSGPVADTAVVASPWTPDPGLAGKEGVVAPEYVWSALDCPSIWALVLQEPSDSSDRAVSARMEVQQRAPVVAGAPHVVMAWAIGRDARARTGGAAILSATGEPRAVARHTLAVTDWGVPLNLTHWM